MKRIESSSSSTPRVATIGFFDGVHRGHCCLIEQVCKAAALRGMESSVVTFPAHPRQVMNPAFSPQLLTTCEEKLLLLGQTGIDSCLMLPFTPQLASLTACRFMQLLAGQYGVRALVIGYDHRFGHNRSEGFDDYLRYGRELDMEVIQAEPLHCGDAVPHVSSSHIRQLLQQGDVVQAASLLGYRYFLQGTVEEGYQVGRTLGYPTANLQLTDSFKLIPANGVYAVRVTVDEAQTYDGMLCIGHRPTLHNGTHQSIEVHLFDFTGNLYHHTLRIEFVQYTRSERQFSSLDELRQRMALDEQEIRTLLRG